MGSVPLWMKETYPHVSAVIEIPQEIPCKGHVVLFKSCAGSKLPLMISKDRSGEGYDSMRG